jgi:transducin (beta)-like 1
MDHVVLLWTEACVVTARYTTHQGPVLDVDWRDGRQFATASMDKKICVFETGKTSPVKEVDGHRGDVNVVSWSPEGDYLASCSVDCAVKVWRVSSSLSKPQHDFREHTREVCCLAWCPVSTEANGHTTPHLLASGSIDTTVTTLTDLSILFISTSLINPTDIISVLHLTRPIKLLYSTHNLTALLIPLTSYSQVKLWDLERGECVLTLSKHVHPVTVLRFSQDGRYNSLTASHRARHHQHNVNPTIGSLPPAATIACTCGR